MLATWCRLRWEKPLRQEVRPQLATFWAQVELQHLQGLVSFSVHGDALAIGHRKINRLIWDVLVNAGAHPIGPPPER